MRAILFSASVLAVALFAAPSAQPFDLAASIANRGDLAQDKPKSPLTSADLYKLQFVGDVQLSPDGTHVAYAVTHNDRPGRPYSDTWIRNMSSGRVTKLNGGAGPRWSPAGARWWRTR